MNAANQVRIADLQLQGVKKVAASPVERSHV